MSTALAIAFTGALIFLAHLFVALFRKTRIPDALLLIAIGIVLGPVTHLVSPDHLGKVGPVFSMLALAVILFEGGQETSLHVLRSNWRAALGLILPAFLATTVAVALLVHATLGLGPNRCLMIGAIVGSTSPTVIVAMARHLEMRSGPRLVLTLETAVSDVLCVVMVLGFIQAAKDGGLRIPAMIGHLGLTFGISAVIGTVAGLAWAFLLGHLRTLNNNIFLTLALVLVMFGAMEMIHMSGGIAVLCFGGAITNSSGLNVSSLGLSRFGRATSFTDREKAFFGEAVFLLKTFFFVYLGLSLRMSDSRLILMALILVGLKILIRIPLVNLTLPRSETRRDASLMSAMASMGLAAAVLASLPAQEGLEGGEMIRDLTYAIILASIVANSVLVFLIDRTPFGKAYGRLFPGFRDRDRASEGDRM